MKRIYFLVCIFTIILSSCNKDDYDEIKTSLPITIPIAINKEPGQDEYSFSASKTYFLTDNEDVEDYLDDMKYITPKGHSEYINGLADGDTIKNIKITIDSETDFISSNNITNSAPNLSQPVSLGTFCNILATEKQITFTVTGTTKKPMNFDLDMTFQIAVGY